MATTDDRSQHSDAGLGKTGPSAARLVTFYSYKGGVGRTMALANAACQLARRHGLNVIAVDWDLEAPGLHYYFGLSDDDLRTQPGLIDYLEDFIAEVAKGPTGQVPPISRYLVQPAERIRDQIRFGSIRLLTCGKTNNEYMSRVRRFDWEQFYSRQSGFQIIETLKTELLINSDISLIDARSGQSDIGATPTIQVPDAIILLFTSNQQNLDGTARIARYLSAREERSKQGFEKPTILLVPSRVFLSNTYRRWLHSSANAVYAKLLEEGVLNPNDQPKGLLQCTLSVEPDSSVGEALPVLGRKSRLRDAYFELAAAIADLHGGRAIWSGAQGTLPLTKEIKREQRGTVRPSRVTESAADKARALEAALARRDEHQAARLRYELGLIALEEGRLKEAEDHFRLALSYYQDRKETLRVLRINFDLARVRVAQGRTDEALRLFRDIITRSRELADQSLSAAAMHAAGGVLATQRRFGEAWNLFADALSVVQRADVPRAESTVLVSMGALRAEEGRLDEAWQLYSQSLAVASDKGDAHGRSRALFAMGELREKQGNYEEALSLNERSLAIDERTGDLEGQMASLAAIGDLLFNRKRFDEARHRYEHGLELARSGNISHMEARFTHELGTVYAAEGRFAEANELFERALALRERVDPSGVPVTLLAMAQARAGQDKNDEAEKLFQRALKSAEQQRNSKAVGVILISVAQWYERRELLEKALPFYQRAISNAADDDFETRALALVGIGDIQRARKNFNAALEAYKQATPLFDRVGDVRGRSLVLCLTALVFADQQMDDEALKYFEQGLSLDPNKDTQAATLFRMAEIRRNRNESSEASRLYERALQFAIEAKDDELMRRIQSSMARFPRR